VWIDERFVPGRVLGVELPTWGRVGPRRVRAGEPLQLLAWLDEAGHGAATLSVSVAHADATAPEAASPTLRVFGPGGRRRAVQLRWCPGDTDVGRHVFTLQATSPGGLTTRTSFGVQVEPAGGRRGALPHLDGRGACGR